MASAAQSPRDVSLNDKYAVEAGRVYLTGIQALVRLPMMQRRRDAAAGLNTAGFISGYRGSPLGGFDLALWQARPFLERQRIHFQPGLNEDLGATAVWGSQQVNLWPGARADGVFGMWYAKGPGVDRSLDALKHANAAGTSRLGGVLALAGDDHAAKSSTLPHQSDYAFQHCLMPVLNPSGVQEIIDYGLIGWALSRYSGLWIALKCVTEIIDSAAAVLVGPGRGRFVVPEDFTPPPDGLNIRWPDPAAEQEERLLGARLDAARAFVRANRLDRVLIDGGAERRRLGIVSTGKSALDVLQALNDLGLSESRAADKGISLYKVAMSWPLEPEGVRAFAAGLDEILVVEEKRPVIESQLKEFLYHGGGDRPPRVIGKRDDQDRPLLAATGELSSAEVAVVIGRRLLALGPDDALARRVAFLDAENRRRSHRVRLARKPTFCSGCPHNGSTVVPLGSRAIGGIGCHYMATWMDRQTETYTQMGGEGAPWIGQAPFTMTRHVFANLGDGTWFHSGSLAIRAAISAGVNITYKILYNDAVAMTGGQPLDPRMSVARLTRMLAAEGVSRMIVVSDEPEKYGDPMLAGFAGAVGLAHRDDLERVQMELRSVSGVSVLIYDQTCAAEKRRRRHRGAMDEPLKRVVINEAVCEACGDCSKKSNCVSVVPFDTDYGRKRRIDQSSCNKDYSCVDGQCPSFVTVIGGRPRVPRTARADPSVSAGLPEPIQPHLDRPYGIYIAGVGGTGIVTVGALLGMAAHLEGKGVAVLDITGMAQKGGAVTTGVRIARDQDDLRAARIPAGGADLVLGCDLVVAGAGESLSKMARGRTRVVLNANDAVTLEFLNDPDFRAPRKDLIADIRAAVHESRPGTAVHMVEAGRLATALLGDALTVNLFLLGYAWQLGLVPLSADSILRAIELNGAAVTLNRQAFAWGRRAAHDPATVATAAAAVTPPAMDPPPIRSLDAMIARRVADLTAYQDHVYAARYHALVRRARAAESQRAPGRSGLAEAVARNYFKLLATKDEYEVARLYADGAFERQIAAQFEGDYRLEFHLAPPFLARPDPLTGEPRKTAYGPWMMRVFKWLHRFRHLRGGRWDPFKDLPERQLDRRLIAEYEATVAELINGLTLENHRLAVDIAALPDRIRGYGSIKERNAAVVKATERALIDAFRGRDDVTTLAAE